MRSDGLMITDFLEMHYHGNWGEFRKFIDKIDKTDKEITWDNTKGIKGRIYGII